jgi:hypothetical protein
LNIFYLDADFSKCAEFHCDKHVIKMLLESAQILCSVLWMNEVPAPYKATHLKHPCVIWANESLSNWLWLKNLSHALNEEYKYRFERSKNHKSYDVILSLEVPPLLDLGLTNRPLVMPEEFRLVDPVEAYRLYYKINKQSIGRWTKREVPNWFLLET